MSLTIAKINCVSPVEAEVTVQADKREDLVGDLIRTQVASLVAEKGYHGFGVERITNPYPVNPETGEESPMVFAGENPVVKRANVPVVYHQQFRVRRGF
mgnify:CR=1 FL=1